MRSVKWFLQALKNGEINYVVFTMGYYLLLSITFRIVTISPKFRTFIIEKLKISISMLIKLLLTAVFIFLSAIAKAFIKDGRIAIGVIVIFGVLACTMIFKTKDLPLNDKIKKD